MSSPHLHTLTLLAGEGGLHHAVILTQSPGLFDKLDVVDSRGGDVVGSEGVFTWRLGGPLRVVDVEDDVTFANVEVPGDDRGGVDDFDHELLGQKQRSGKEHLNRFSIFLNGNVKLS